MKPSAPSGARTLIHRCPSASIGAPMTSILVPSTHAFSLSSRRGVRRRYTPCPSVFPTSMVWGMSGRGVGWAGSEVGSVVGAGPPDGGAVAGGVATTVGGVEGCWKPRRVKLTRSRPMISRYPARPPPTATAIIRRKVNTLNGRYSLRGQGSGVRGKVTETRGGMAGRSRTGCTG